MRREYTVECERKMPDQEDRWGPQKKYTVGKWEREDTKEEKHMDKAKGEILKQKKEGDRGRGWGRERARADYIGLQTARCRAASEGRGWGGKKGPHTHLPTYLCHCCHHNTQHTPLAASIIPLYQMLWGVCKKIRKSVQRVWHQWRIPQCTVHCKSCVCRSFDLLLLTWNKPQ